MILTAHSGCDGTPMNSKQYIEHAGTIAVDAVEVDVRRSGDGTLVLTHDRSDSSDRVTMKTCFEILLGTGKMINADLKEKGIETDVLSLAAEVEFDRKRIVFTGCVKDPVTMIERIAPAEVFFNPEEMDPLYYEKLRGMDDAGAEEYNREVFGKIAGFGYRAVNINHIVLTPSLITCCRDLHLEISAWTINDPEMIDRVKALGVLNITTKEPERYLKGQKFHKSGI